MDNAYLTVSESDAIALALTRGQIGLPLGMAGISPSLVGVSVRQLRGIA